MLQVIDKSQTIINKKDLKQLEIKVGHLLQEFKKINTTYQANKTFEKLQTFKQDKEENRKLLNKQIKKLANLKTSYAVDKIYKSRQK
jgi:hypothetical protein